MFKLERKNSNCSDVKIILDLIHLQIHNITVSQHSIKHNHIQKKKFFFEKKNVQIETKSKS